MKILTPHYADEPWRAEIREGTVPGRSRTTSGYPRRAPAERAAGKLEKLFAGDAEDDSG